MNPALIKISRVSSYALCLFAGIIYFLGPTQTIQRFLPQNLPILLLALTALVGGIFSWNLYRVLQNRRESTTYQNPSVSRLSALPVILGIVFLILTVSGWDTPLDIDENVHATLMANQSYAHELNPFNTDVSKYTQNHLVSQFASIVSLNVFGVSPLALRFPALVFSLAFVIILLLWGRLSLSNFTLSAILLHCCVNQTIVWYGHSMRGYISALFFATGALLIVGATANGNYAKIKWIRSTYAVFLLGSILSNTFGGVFVCLLLLTLLGWLRTQQPQGDPRIVSLCQDFLKIHLAYLPLIGVLFLYKAIFLSNIGDFSHSAENQIFNSIALAFGTSHAIIAKVILLACAFSFAMRLRQPRNNWDPYLWFSTVTFVFFTLLFCLLDIRVTKARFFILFIPALLIALFQPLSLPIRGRILHRFSLLILLALAPLLYSKDVFQHFNQVFLEFHQFTKKAKIIGKQTPNPCFGISGQKDVTHWLGYFYLRSFPNSTKDACTSNLHIHIPSKGAESVKTALPPLNTLEVLHENPDGIVLYRVFSPSPSS